LKVQVSTDGGRTAVWRPDGSELLYRAFDTTLMSVSVRASGASLTFGSPVALFKLPTNHYDVTRDGRILTLVPTGDLEASALTIVSNWRSRLTTR
jgi:hypothetical protein